MKKKSLTHLVSALADMPWIIEIDGNVPESVQKNSFFFLFASCGLETVSRSLSAAQQKLRGSD